MSITNEGNLNVQSLAFAKGMIATAIASFGTDVIDQEAQDGFTASASIANATTGNVRDRGAGHGLRDDRSCKGNCNLSFHRCRPIGRGDQ